jgi:hypothetical protein
MAPLHGPIIGNAGRAGCRDKYCEAPGTKLACVPEGTADEAKPMYFDPPPLHLGGGASMPAHRASRDLDATLYVTFAPWQQGVP